MGNNRAEEFFKQESLNFLFIRKLFRNDFKIFRCVSHWCVIIWTNKKQQKHASNVFSQEIPTSFYLSYHTENYIYPAIHSSELLILSTQKEIFIINNNIHDCKFHSSFIDSFKLNLISFLPFHRIEKIS